MKKDIGTYRGTRLYEADQVNAAEGQALNVKIVGEGVHPDQQNMKVDFVAEASSRDEGVHQIKKKIDRYLDEHDIQKFNRPYNS
ncbi:hypothetical protein [Fodinibius sp. Rm-B-1B1-1]|uniref:hypothetical protein n=1 Tax=Fodinibius alkaliphilus TaxID=3140241 RepID=UPI00315A3766